MNKTYKIQLPRNKEAQNIRTRIKDGTIEVEVELKEKWEPRDGDICFITSHYSFILAKKGKMWDAQKKAVVDLPRWRAERDCRYYYIKNCDATIHPGDDNRFEVDNNLYESGNYFKTKEAAEIVAEQIREVFKNSKVE